MAKIKSTKRALLLSGLALLMCFSMLVGSTYAWFTDSVTSTGNKIVSGNLDVQLLMHNGKEYVDISKSTSPIFGAGSKAQDDNANSLWEPGKTQVAYLAIKNGGNLALKYNVALEVHNVTQNLNKVMKYSITPDAKYDEVSAWDPTIAKGVNLGKQVVTEDETMMNPGDVHYFALSIHMDDNASNAYQNGEISFDMTVLATQAGVESDSFSNQYDANAYNLVVRTPGQLTSAFEQGEDVYIRGRMNGDTSVYMFGEAFPQYASEYLMAKGGTLTGDKLILDSNKLFGLAVMAGPDSDAETHIKDIEISGTTESVVYVNENGKEVTLSGVTVVADGGGAVYGEGITAGLVLNDCTVKQNGLSAGYQEWFETAVLAAQGAQITINGGSYTSSKYAIYTCGSALNGKNSVVTVNGGTFIGALGVNGSDKIVIKGGTFDHNPSAYVADGYKSIDNGNGTWTVEENVPVTVNGVACESFGEAMATITSDSSTVVKLNADFTDEKFSIPANADVTLDLGGNTLSYTKGSVYVTDAAGNEVKQYYCIGISAGATLTITNGNIKYTTGDRGLISNHGTLNLDGGTYSVSDTTYSAPIVLSNKESGVVNATGATFTSSGKNMVIDNDGTMTLTDCVIAQENANATDGAAIDNQGLLTIKGCTISNTKTTAPLIGQHKATAVTTIQSGVLNAAGKNFSTIGSYVVNGGTFKVEPVSAANVTINGTISSVDGVWKVEP